VTSTVLVAHFRAGFEAEAGADLRLAAEAAGADVALDAPIGRGYVVAVPRPYDAQRWPRALAAAPPVFVRSLFFGSGLHALFDANRARGRPDRVVPLAALVAAFRDRCPVPGLPPAARVRARFGELRLETADTNDGKALSGLCRALETPLAQALLAEDALAETDADGRPPRAPALHVLFADGANVYVGGSLPPWGSPWAMGIPRLRMPREAPSRSTLKLAEAFATFLGEREPELLRPGRRAVDLGAAPGGWTWQLAYRGLRVTAVDNGPLKGEVAHDSLVTHLKVDGLKYRPPRPVDWMVCDIAETPSRIAVLVAAWIARGDARQTIFNLKLPMKKRWDEVRRCEALIADTLARAGVRATLRLRQLYHDREEVTGYLVREGG
jgi:23S rRNA (cytidine2498-2'-O)-methyltransferase